jgi:lantibiotic modifying enzyme
MDERPAIGFLPRHLLLQGARQVARLGAEGFAGRREAEASPWGLYGALGEALFWAALARVDGDEGAAGRALVMTEPLLEALDAMAAGRSVPPPRLGGFTGLSGSIWGLATIAHLLENAGLRRRAVAAAGLVTAERIAEDRLFDVVFGSAGAVLGLTALAAGERDIAARERLLASARACASHLLASRDVCGAWDAGGSGQLQSGFAHGASGIAFALLALDRLAPDETLEQAAAAAFAFERTLYLAERDRYLPFRGFDPAGTLLVAWCWGAPGIALARSARLGDPVLRQEAVENMDRMLAQKQTLEDHLCCGNLGRATIYARLARGGDALRPPESFAAEHREVARLVASVLARAQRRGLFGHGNAELDRPWMPGLLKGTPGIGYALLHLAAPSLVPCPLVLEAVPDPSLRGRPEAAGVDQDGQTP